MIVNVAYTLLIFHFCLASSLSKLSTVLSALLKPLSDIGILIKDYYLLQLTTSHSNPQLL